MPLTPSATINSAQTDSWAAPAVLGPYAKQLEHTMAQHHRIGHGRSEPVSENGCQRQPHEVSRAHARGLLILDLLPVTDRTTSCLLLRRLRRFLRTLEPPWSPCRETGKAVLGRCLNVHIR